MLVEVILDQCQERLHDDGVLWPRSELLDYLNDGYRQLLGQSHACVRPVIFDVPPRTAWSGTQEWEDRHGPGTFQRFTRPAQQVTTTHLWESEFLEGITPTAGDTYAVTQLWERAVIDSDLNRHFRFAIGKEHERPLRIYWDDRQLAGASSRELDLRDTTWWNESGEPILWLKGSGRDRSFELFDIVTSYNQPYILLDAEAGIPRYFMGERSYSVSAGLDRWDGAYTGAADIDGLPGLLLRITEASSSTEGLYHTFGWEAELDDSTDTETYVATHWWEAEFADVADILLGLGNGRYITSSDRHYLAAPVDGSDELPVGAIRDFKASEDSVLLFEVVVNPRDLTEDDAPVLIPNQLHKYLRFYTLAKAFARPGEGQRPDVASHYAQQFQVGVTVLTALGNQTLIDRVYAREDFVPAAESRPPRVRLPSNYPRVL